MKLLALADLHGELAGIEKLPKKGYDVVVFVGDITNFGPAGLAREAVQKLKSLGKPVLVTPGNCDPREIEGILEEEGVNLHKKKTTIKGVDFFGLGGSNPTPFDTPFELSEEEIKEALERQGGGEVLLTHAPPKDTVCDMLPDGAHVGSDAVREAIKEFKPKIVICGHVHEGMGTDRIGESIIVNPGEASKGSYAIVDLGGDVTLRGGKDE